MVPGGGRGRKERGMAGARARRVLLAATLVVAGGLVACGEKGSPASGGGGRTPSPQAFPVTLADDDGVRVTLDQEPKRIVTFAPSNTEIMFALSLGDRLVGVSGSFDDYPAEAKEIERVGGAGEFGVDPNLEKVVSLDPDLLLAISGGDEWKKRLRDLGVPVFTINATNFDDLLHDIETVGLLTGAGDRAADLVSSMRKAESAVEARVDAEGRVGCFFEAYYPPLTTVGPHTFIFDLLELAGCDPVSAGAKADYPEWSVERLVSESFPFYLVASESGASPKAVAARPGFRAIRAVREGKVYLVDSDLISRPGPRVVMGLEDLADVLHPGSGGE